ncbi:MAG TPA: hypothetical protein VMW38_24325, partial [Terriglobia bacterium]|nr:hypothetical protein [Terriglobia bacterium]
MNTQFVNRMARKHASLLWLQLAGALMICFVCGVCPSYGANDWTFRGGPEGGLVAHGAVNPFDSNVVYVTNSAGIFKTTNGGTTWTSLNAYWGADAKILIDPTNPNTVYLASGLVIKSTDAGVHWTVLNTKTSCTDYVWDLVIDPKSTSTLYVIMASTSGSQLNYYVLKSTDGGGNWTRLTWTAYGLAVDPTNDSILYASNTAGVQKSTNGGSTWSPAGAGLPPLSSIGVYGTVVVDPKTPATLYVVAGNAVYKSTNSGDLWSNSSTGISGAGLTDPVIDPVNPGTLYVVGADSTSGLGTIYKTTNGGGQWSLLNLGIPTASDQFVALGAANTATLYSGTLSHGVLKSTNSGTTWAAKNSGLKADDNQMVLDSTNKNNIYVGINGLGVFQSTDGGSNWVSRNSGLPSLQVAGLAISPVNPKVLYVSLLNATVLDFGGTKLKLPGIFKSTDGAASWTATTTPPDNFGFSAPTRLAADPVDANGIYALGLATGVYHSTDGGTSWTVSNTGLPTTSAFPYSIVIDPQTPANLYLGMLSGSGSSPLVYKSTDSGSTWTASGSGLPNASGVWELGIDPKTPSTLYAAVVATQTVNGGMFKSLDSAGSWTAANTGLSNFDWESFYKSYFDNLDYSGGLPICATYIT